MKRSIEFPVLLLLIIFPFNCYSQIHGNTINWWNNRIILNKIKLPDDRYCAGHYIISSLQISGIPICAEYCPITKGKDVNLGIKTDISDTDKIWMSVPRVTPWEVLSTANNVASATAVLEYYAHQAGDYEIRFIKEIPVMLPVKSDVITEKIKIQELLLPDTCVHEVYQHLGNVLIENNIGYIIPIYGLRSIDSPRSKNINDVIDNFHTNVKFDLKFSGGTLAELLCEISRLLGESDDEHIYFWTLGGLSDERCLGFGSVERAQYDNLVSGEGKDYENIRSQSGENIIIKKY